MKRTGLFSVERLVLSVKYTLAFVVVLLSFLPVEAQNVGDAFYIYRNDGQFNAFFRDEVDSITYSCYDLDSVYYDDYVTQVVYTPDSIYRIPLAAIDSVGFVQPEREFQPDVMCMDETWLPYVIRISENSITFSHSTPTGLLPRQGQVLVTETYEHPFETGFSGRVSQIKTYPDSIVCEVEEVLLSDIYRRLIAVGMSYSEVTEENAANAPKRIFGINTNPGVKFPIPPIIDLAVGPVTVSCTPSIVLKYIVCLWENNLKDYVEIWCDQTYEGSVSINANLETPYTPEPRWLGNGISVPTGVPGLYGRVQVGGFFRTSGYVQLSATREFYRRGKSGFVYSEDSGFSGINEWDNPAEEDWEASISIGGSMSAGVAGRLQFGIMHEKLASADITLYVGPEISGNAEVKATELIVDKNLYSSIKDSEITLSIIADVVPGYQLVGFKSSKVMPDPPTHKDAPVSLKFTWPLNHWYLVPEFNNLKWQTVDKGGNLSGDINRNLLPRVSLGWALYDENDNLYRSEYFSETYRKIEDWPRQGMYYHIDNLKKNTTYKAYPMVKLMGVEMRTDQSVDVCVKDCPVTIDNFKQTKSQYKKGGFTHEGVNYDYRYDVAVTVSIENLEGVKDWGYVYRDPNGRDKEISLKQFGSSCTDSRYAYFRDTSPATVTLMGYVMYEGDTEPVYGEPTNYTVSHAETSCPDANHPHMIDLGIGTLWACCNVGASAPEEYGGYYAWGETSEKSVYNWDTYQDGYYIYDGDYSHLVNIGSDISGTGYDAATANWGSPWRMPTRNEIEKLVYSCTYEWTTENGVKGGKFTGPSGGSIFLPAAGCRYDGGLYFAGSYGYYWSSALNGSSPYNAYYLYFGSGNANWYSYYRSRGHTVRPVR